jgi:hypothetical protein
VLEASDALASLLLAEIADDGERIEQAFLRVLARAPRSEEAAAVRKFLADFPAPGTEPGKAAKGKAGAKKKPAADAQALEKRRQVWSAFVQTLFQSAEFRYLG